MLFLGIRNGDVMSQHFPFMSDLTNEDKSTAKPLRNQEISISTSGKLSKTPTLHSQQAHDITFFRDEIPGITL